MEIIHPELRNPHRREVAVNHLPHHDSLQIVYQLHTSLEFRQITQMFWQSIRRYLPCDGIHYWNEALKLDFTVGKISNHSKHYFLTNGQDQLGEITFSRQLHFNDADIPM